MSAPTAEGAHTPAIVAPVAWQNFGKPCLTGQHGMRPIYLSASPKGVLMDRDPVTDRLIPLTDETPVARELVRIINERPALLAENEALRASNRDLVAALQAVADEAQTFTDGPKSYSGDSYLPIPTQDIIRAALARAEKISP